MRIKQTLTYLVIVISFISCNREKKLWISFQCEDCDSSGIEVVLKINSDFSSTILVKEKNIRPISIDAEVPVAVGTAKIFVYSKDSLLGTSKFYVQKDNRIYVWINSSQKKATFVIKEDFPPEL